MIIPSVMRWLRSISIRRPYNLVAGSPSVPGCEPPRIGPIEGRRADAEVAEKSVVEPVDDAVHGQLLSACPHVFDDRRLTDVHRLLDHVQLAEPVQALVLRK